MAVKLIALLLVLAIIVSVAVIGAFWYLKRRAELKHEQEMTEAELQHEREQSLWDDE